MYGSKKVNVFPTLPIYTITPPISCNKLGIKLTTSDIRACIVGRARVEEVLSDGTKVLLNFSNYDKDNSSLAKNKPTVAVNSTPIVEVENIPAPVEEVVETNKEEVVESETVEIPVIEESKEEENISETEEETPVVEETESVVKDYNNKKGKSSNKVRYNKQ